LRVLSSGDGSREVVLALPLNRLIVKMVRVPGENREDPSAFAEPLLKAMSPYPDEPLTVSCETVSGGEDSLVVIAAALPESATDDIASALDEKKLSVTRIDALAIGELRGLWQTLGTDDGARRLVLMNGPDCLSAIVIDGDTPSAIRAVSGESDLKREMMLSLLEAEDFGGVRELKEIVIAYGAGSPAVSFDGLEAFAPLRRVEIGEDAALVGVAERSADPAAFNAMPQSWRDMLAETRFKAKLVRRLAVAGGIWALLLATVVGVPIAYGYMTDHQKGLCREHARQYNAVKEMKRKVEVVKKYSDHARGALEIMKAVSDRLPGGVTLSSWSFKREEGFKISGDAETADEVYTLKDRMVEMTVTDAQGEAVTLFPVVKLNGPTASKGRQKFDLECQYVTEGEQ